MAFVGIGCIDRGIGVEGRTILNAAQENPFMSWVKFYVSTVSLAASSLTPSTFHYSPNRGTTLKMGLGTFEGTLNVLWIYIDQLKGNYFNLVSRISYIECLNASMSISMLWMLGKWSHPTLSVTFFIPNSIDWASLKLPRIEYTETMLKFSGPKCRCGQFARLRRAICFDWG